jgi:hypothetical protein
MDAVESAKGSLSIAECRLALDLPHPFDLLGIPGYRPFLAGPGHRHGGLRVHWVSHSELHPDWVSQSLVRGGPFEYRPILNCPTVEQRYRGRQADELILLGVGVADYLQPATWTMESFAFPPVDVARYLRSRIFCLLGSHLAANAGLLLHGSGFVIDGLAAAAIGPPDAGKTTAARLAQGDRLLSDDVVAVTNLLDQPQLHATPLGRESDGVGAAPLRAIFFPRKQATFSLKPISAREVLIRSAAEQADTFQSLFPPYGGMAIRNLGHLFRKVPAYELGFSLDGIDREAIRRVLSGAWKPE